MVMSPQLLNTYFLGQWTFVENLPILLLKGFWNTCAKELNGHGFASTLMLLYFFPLLQPWPEEALERVAETFLETLELSENERQEVIPICQTFHTSAKTLSERFDVVTIKLK